MMEYKSPTNIRMANNMANFTQLIYRKGSRAAAMRKIKAAMQHMPSVTSMATMYAGPCS